MTVCSSPGLGSMVEENWCCKLKTGREIKLFLTLSLVGGMKPAVFVFNTVKRIYGLMYRSALPLIEILIPLLSLFILMLIYIYCDNTFHNIFINTDYFEHLNTHTILYSSLFFPASFLPFPISLSTSFILCMHI